MLNMSFSEIERVVEAALKHCRDPYGLVQLARSPLAELDIVTSCFLPNEQPNSTIHGLTVRAVLHWAVDRLQPSGQIVWGDYRWRLYLVLFFPYIDASKSFKELAHLMNVGEKAVYDSRQKALSAVTTILYDELRQPQDLAGRKRVALLARYAYLAKAEQLLLRILSLFRHPIPVQFVHQLATEANLEDGAGVLRNLVVAGLVVSNTRRAEVEVEKTLRVSLNMLVEFEQQRDWHLVASAYYLQQQEYLEAAEHLQRGGKVQQAAELVVEQYQKIVDSLQINELRKFLAGLRSNELPEGLWSQIKLVTGQLATMSQDIDTAIIEYRLATQTKDVLIKAQAYHHLAHVCKQRNVDEALSYYGRCIDLLSYGNPQHQLLARAATDRAWLLLEHQRDMALVSADLALAQTIVAQQPPQLWLDIRSDLHNTQSMLFYSQQDHQSVLKERWQAWIAANEANDLNRKVNTLHNLGQAYMNLEQYEQALNYLSQCEQLSRDVGHRRIHGLSHKTIGACHYFMGDRERAIYHYQIAFQIFTEMNQANWLATVCYDLVEAYAEQGKIVESNRYYLEGLKLAQDVGATALIGAFEQLAEKYNHFKVRKLNKQQRRQQLALLHVAEFGSITNKAYQEIAGVKYRTALKDLNELVEQGTLARVGEGRGTRYVAVGEKGENN